jgi:DNA-binding CsgD family transcriptional regulator
VDWSHALLTEPERVLFARLAVFMGGFDLDAAEAVAGSGDVERFQVLDLLTLVVDKSLVVAETASGPMRYRLLETVRQYALEKLGESGQADAVRARHRDHYTAVAALLDTSPHTGYEQRLEQTDTEIDNLRAAFAWSRENCDIGLALALASSLQPLWLARGRIREGSAWFDVALTDADVHRADVAPAVRARALADNSVLDVYAGATDRMEQAQQALAIAREVDDPALLAWALVACGGLAVYPEVALPYLAEAIGLARSIDDNWQLSQTLHLQAYGLAMAGEPIAARAAAEEGRDLADAIGDRFVSRACRWDLGVAQLMTGELVGAIAQLREVIAEADATHDTIWGCAALCMQALALAYHGDPSAARAAANAAIEAAAELGGFYPGSAYVGLIAATVAAGDVAAADDAVASGWQHINVQPKMAAIFLAYVAQAALARGDLTAARRLADEAVAATTGLHLSVALTTRAGVAIAQGEPEQADRDAHDTLATAASTGAYIAVPDPLECLAALAVGAGSYHEAARLYGAAESIRERMAQVRFKIFDAFVEFSVATLRDAMGEKDFESAWAEGTALSTDEAIAYTQRGRGERKRPSSGWASLTPTERDVVRLVSEGLANNDIATRLFVSPRTVQTHLTHVYSKLGLTSRVQLAQEAARHG